MPRHSDPSVARVRGNDAEVVYALFDSGFEPFFGRSLGEPVPHVKIGFDDLSAVAPFQPVGDGGTRCNGADEANDRDKSIHAAHCPSGSDTAAKEQIR